MRPIGDVAGELGLSQDDLFPWGPGVAKIAPHAAFDEQDGQARLVLVSAINPTPAGEGKTTCTIGLTQAARRLGLRAACALRQPSLGPVFGVKGGGAGGGQSVLVPSDRVNLHFTGDIHAVTSAHNLLAAMVDNQLHFGAGPAMDSRQITWRRVLDMNDRSLRRVVVGLGGKSMGVPREDGFDISAASEVMAVLCLARDYADLKARLARLLVGFSRDGQPVTAHDLGADGAMAALLRDAFLPNLVQTLEGAPALVHGGPFGNIAHGCNSVVATRMLLRCTDLVFTEAGFGFDLGAEKFLDIKCRAAGIWPQAIVLVVTLRALKVHGGVRPQDAGGPNLEALARGMENLDKHLESVRQFGIEPIVAVNLRDGDSPNEVRELVDHLHRIGIEAGAIDVYRLGGKGAVELVKRIAERASASTAVPRFMYELEDSTADKIRKVARAIYGAQDVDFTKTAAAQMARAKTLGYGTLPVCIAKTHLSLSDDEKLLGRPRDFEMTVREVRIAAGAGFLVPLTGDILTMPGLPRHPQATDIDLQPDGTIVGLQ